jgi:hypothetical protein
MGEIPGAAGDANVPLVAALKDGTAEHSAIGARTETRIAWLTLAIGAGAAFIFFARGEKAWAGGIAMGAVLAWINFRWLARGLDSLVAASIGQGGQVVGQEGDSGDEPDIKKAQVKKAQVPVGTYFTALFRYALIGLSVYVIFVYLHVPLLSLLFGLCTLGAAAMAASVYEILRPAG